MDLELREESMAGLVEHARIPIAFEVNRILLVSVTDSGLGEFALSERKLDVSYLKDYDAIDEEKPERWAQRFDLSNWGLFSAHSAARHLGGTVLAYNTKGVDMLEDRNDLAVIWDIRVHPDFRKQGIGSALFRAAEAWAAERVCRQLKVETQNTNVAACRFYARQGCLLGAINRFAYKEFPDETQLVWYKSLIPAGD
jgi:ribosomal protein S18 acetylase RimI-like enzyme